MYVYKLAEEEEVEKKKAGKTVNIARNVRCVHCIAYFVHPNDASPFESNYGTEYTASTQIFDSI